MEVLYGEETQKCVETMSFSGKKLGDYPLYVKYLLMVKKAAATANELSGAISRPNAEAIIRSCELAWHTFDSSQYPVDVFHGGGGIGINMNLNEVLASLIQREGITLSNPIAEINRSQSTADVCHTAMRMTIYAELANLLNNLDECGAQFENKKSAYEYLETIARTCMMDAMAIRWGDRISGIVEVLNRRSKALKLIRENLLKVNLGGTVIGSGDGATDEYRAIVLPVLSELFGSQLDRSSNLYDAAQNIDELVELSQSLSNLSQVLMKISQNLRFLSSGPEAGIGEIKLPKTQAGSSFFPGKVNPVIPEMMIQSSMMVVALTRAVESCQSHAEPDLNVFEEFAGILVMDQLHMLSRSISLFTEYAVLGMEVVAETSMLHSQSLVPKITKMVNIYGYEKVSNAINSAVRNSGSLHEALKQLDT
jgi:aspartate ammonia-lyase